MSLMDGSSARAARETRASAPPALPVRSAAEKGFDPLRGRFHRFLALRPIRRANFAVLFDVLHGVEQSNDFIHATTDGPVADVLRHDGAALVDDEGTAVGDPFGLVEHVVRARDLLGEVGDDGVA